MEKAIGAKLIVRQVLKSGAIMVSPKTTGVALGTLYPEYLTYYKEFNSYKIMVNNMLLNVRAEPNTTSPILLKIKPGSIHIVLEESANGWGRIRVSSHEGWINLNYVSKI